MPAEATLKERFLDTAVVANMQISGPYLNKIKLTALPSLASRSKPRGGLSNALAVTAATLPRVSPLYLSRVLRSCLYKCEHAAGY